MMIAVADGGRTALEQRSQPLLALKERSRDQLLARDEEQIEDKVHQMVRPSSVAACISANEVVPSARTAHSSPSK